MPPKKRTRSRSPKRRSKSRSRSPPKAKKPKAEEKKEPSRKTKTSALASAAAVAPGPSVTAQQAQTAMDQYFGNDFRSDVAHGVMPPSVLGLIGQIGNFHPCDGPTDMGKLCMKGKAFFQKTNGVDCREYCADKENCMKWITAVHDAIPEQIQVIKNGVTHTGDLTAFGVSFDDDMSYISIEKIIDPEQIEIQLRSDYDEKDVLIAHDKSELTQPYLWKLRIIRIKGHRLKNGLLMNWEDKQVLGMFCDKLREALPWQSKMVALHLSVFYKSKNLDRNTKKLQLVSQLSDILKENLTGVTQFGSVNPMIELSFILKL
jgi:hypothetical protein